MTVTVPETAHSDVTANPAPARDMRSAAWRWSVLAVLAIGVALRAWQYFANASIVLDEAAVARNVLDRHALGLLTPLDYGQVAPAGFLLAVKLCTMLFGRSEWVLRLTPFVFGLASLLLFPLVARSLLQRPAALAAVGPIVVALAAAGVQAYPLATRAGLYMIPLYLLVVAYGTDALGRLLLRRRVGAYGCLLLVPLATYAVVQRLPPDLSEHVRPVMQYVAEHHQTDDAVWVYYGAGQAFEYYQHLIPIGGDVQIGDCDRENPRAYLRQVDVERGQSRVWFVFAHFAAAFRFNERGLLLAYLDTIGHRLDEFHAPPDDQTPVVAAAYLYDLSDAGGLAHADASTFRIRGKFTPARWSCYGVASPIPSRNGAAVKAVMSLQR